MMTVAKGVPIMAPIGPNSVAPTNTAPRATNAMLRGVAGLGLVRHGAHLASWRAVHGQ